MGWFKSVLNMNKLGMPPADPVADRFQYDQPEDLYARLGVTPTASSSELRRAYRMRAKVFHPDVNPGDDASEDAFKLVSEAFTILSDIESRRQYDESREQHARSQSGPAMRNRRFPGQFTGGFLAGTLSVLCLVSLIWLVNAMPKEDVRTALAASTPTEGAATQKGVTLQKRERASHEMVDVQADHESVKKEQLEALSPTALTLKDVDLEIISDAAPTEADTVESPPPLDVAVSTADNGEPSPPLTVRSGTPPLPSRAGRQKPAGPVIVEHVRSAVTRQIRAVRRRDGRAAFAIASPAVQSKFGDAHKFLEMVRTAYPDIPAAKTASFLGLVRTRDEVIARFLLEGSNGRLVEARYSMVRLAGRWRIDGCVIVPR